MLRGRPFTRSRAEQEKVSPGVLRGPGVRTLVPGIYLSAQVEPTLATHLGAFLAVLPAGSAVDGVTALHHWESRSAR